MDIEVALLADAATIDAAGKINIIGAFDRISVSQFPAQHSRIALVLIVMAGTSEMGTHEMEIQLSDPQGRGVLSLNGEMQLVGGPDVGEGIRAPHVLNLDGLVFPEPGRYSFDVKINNKHQVSISFFVEGPLKAQGALA